MVVSKKLHAYPFQKFYQDIGFRNTIEKRRLSYETGYD